MELIFPRSTLAKFTPRGEVGALVALVVVGVTGVDVGVEALTFEAFAGVSGSFDRTSGFKVLETAFVGFSCLLAGPKKQNCHG